MPEVMIVIVNYREERVKNKGEMETKGEVILIQQPFTSLSDRSGLVMDCECRKAGPWPLVFTTVSYTHNIVPIMWQVTVY